MSKIHYITENEVPNLIRNITNGKFFNITFRKKDGTVRSALAQRGVSNPSKHAPPTGTGESAREALNNGRIKFYECKHKNDDGTVTGEYRQASISRVLDITTDGTTYVVVRTEQNV